MCPSLFSLFSTIHPTESALWFTSPLALSASTSPSDVAEGGSIVIEATLNKKGAKVTWQKDDVIIAEEGSAGKNAICAGMRDAM